MGPGSKIILAERHGDTLRIAGHMPYAGLRPGNRPAAQLLGRADQAVPIENPLDLSFSQLGIAIPNLPQAIAPHSDNSGFGLPAQQRRILWNAVQKLNGWPTE